MKKFYKVIFAILILMSLVCVLPINTSNATDFDLSNFDNKGNDSLDTATQNIMATIIIVIRRVGSATAIIMLTYLGIKYIMSAPDEKAEFKNSAYIFIVGAILLFTASNLVGIIYDFASDNASGSKTTTKPTSTQHEDIDTQKDEQKASREYDKVH